MADVKIFFETFGCTSNQADTEVMKTLLDDSFSLTSDLDSADIVVINSCGVIEKTQLKVLKWLKRVRSLKKGLVLAGCLPRIDNGSINIGRPDVVLNPESINQINKALKAAKNREPFQAVDGFFDKALSRGANNGIISPLQISEGCLGSCTYCATRFARGRLRSFNFDRIVETASELIFNGCKELQLTAQDTGIYGKEINRNLPELLNRLTCIPGDFRIRLGMMNPVHIHEILPELIESFKHEKMYKFLHLPVQSGDDEILKKMGRGYSANEFQEIVNDFKENIQGLSLSTDVIIGFPGESDESFNRTYQLVSSLEPVMLNVTRYSSRPGTPASSLNDMPQRIKKERSRLITALHWKISKRNQKSLVGKDMQVLLTSYGKDGTVLGRSDCYKQVVLKKFTPGEFKYVRIMNSTPHYLIGEERKDG